MPGGRRAEARLDVELIEAEMREIPRGGSFDAAVCMGNSFDFLDLTGTREFAVALAGAVRPGGDLVIDFNTAAGCRRRRRGLATPHQQPSPCVTRAAQGDPIS